MQEQTRTSILDLSKVEPTKKFNFFKKKKEEQTEKPHQALFSLMENIAERVRNLEEKADILKQIDENLGEMTVIIPEQSVILPRNKEKELIETLLRLKINCCLKNNAIGTMQIQEKSKLDTSKSSSENTMSKN